MKILIYFQDKILEPKVIRLIKTCQHEVVVANSPPQVLSKVISGSIDLILLGRKNLYVQEDMFLETLRKTSPHIPLILLSKSEDEAFLYDDFLDVVPEYDFKRLKYWLEEWKKKRNYALPADNLEVEEEDFAYLQKIIQKEFAFQITQKGPIQWQKGLKKRMALLHIGDVKEYLDFLRYSTFRKIELLKFFQQLTVPETSFFRTQSHFTTLQKKVIPELVKNAPLGHPLRLWSCGCSTGEEPYSLAICMEEIKKTLPVEYTVLATDVNHKYLEMAGQASYHPRSLRNIDPEKKDQYFYFSKGRYILRDPFKTKVQFEYFNLNSKEQFFEPGRWDEFDVIFCENVLIYFPHTKVEEIIQKFYRLLRPKGVLFLGYSESLLNISHSFTCLSYKDQVFYYQKLPESLSLNPTEEESAPAQEGLLESSHPLSPRPFQRPKTPSKLFPFFWEEMLKKGLFKSSVDDIIKENSLQDQILKPSEKEDTFSEKFWEELIRAEEYIDQKNFPKAREIYQALLKQEEAWQPLTEMALETLKTGKKEMVELFLELFSELKKETAESYYLQGIYYQFQKERESAKRAFEKTVYLKPLFIPGHFQLGEIFAWESNFLRARASFQNILHYLPETPHIRVVTLEGVLEGPKLLEVCQKNLEMLTKNTL